MKASEDQNKIKQLLSDFSSDAKTGSDFYVRYEPFDPRILSSYYGVKLDKTFEELMLTEEVGGADVFLPEADSHVVPVLPNKYFQN